MRDTSVKYFLSTMPGAPVLTGAAGSLVAILDACLVDGWGLLPATTLQVQSGAATVQFSAPHSFLVDAVALVEGVTGTLAALNGQHKVDTVPTSNSITFATDLPDGLAEGPITVKLAPAGWERVFSATNKRVYRSLAPESLGHMLRVDETGSTAPFAARVVGYEAMSDIDTGAGTFPTAAQLSGGIYWPVSNISGGNVPWGVFSDGIVLYVYVAPNSYDKNIGYVSAFGDLNKIWDADSAAVIVSGGNLIDSYTFGVSGTVGAHARAASSDIALYMPRSVPSIPGALRAFPVQPWRDFAWYSGSGAAGGSIFGAAPLKSSGINLLCQAIVVDAENVPRGLFPGVRSSPQVVSDASFSGFVHNGRNWLSLRQSYYYSSSSYHGSSYIDVTGPWR